MQWMQIKNRLKNATDLILFNAWKFIYISHNSLWDTGKPDWLTKWLASNSIL